MLSDLLIRSVLNGVLGGRSKRSRRARRFLHGPGGSFWSNPQTMLTAAGLAWGIFDTLQGQSGGSQGAGQAAASSSSSSQWWDPQVPSQPASPPPVPSVTPDGTAASSTTSAASDDVLRIVRLAISAAHADGAMNENERAAVLEQARKAGAGDLIERELASPMPLKSIVAGVTDPAAAATLYVLAFTVLRADEQLTGAERIYLAQLANLLHLDPAQVEGLEKNAGERIDAVADHEQVGG